MFYNISFPGGGATPRTPPKKKKKKQALDNMFPTYFLKLVCGGSWGGGSPPRKTSQKII